MCSFQPALQPSSAVEEDWPVLAGAARGGNSFIHWRAQLHPWVTSGIVPISPGPLQSALFTTCTDTAYKYRMVQFGLAWKINKAMMEWNLCQDEIWEYFWTICSVFIPPPVPTVHFAGYIPSSNPGAGTVVNTMDSVDIFRDLSCFVRFLSRIPPTHSG